MSWLKQGLEYLFQQATAATRPTVVETCGRTYLFQPETGKYCEVKPLDAPDMTHAFGTVAALVEYLREWAKPEAATVIVSPRGICAHMDETSAHRRDIVTVPFFDADLPPERPLSHEDLLLYLDRHTGKIEDEDAIRAVLSVVHAVEGKDLVTRDTGASTRIEIKAARGVQARDVKDRPVDLPKYITITLRIGTREYEEPHRFRLVAGVADGVPRFRLIHLDRDGAVDRFLQRCIQDLRTGLGDGWHVYQGA
ncbi:hypothetical protein [Deferrisoma camini]|uniref:hypothetical protein n=1 Tax=Deferrisoma camini TaxID=1035120 RepID=UPI00046CA0E5|nr:hypothetical protein [Deferrisoma camini]